MTYYDMYSDYDAFIIAPEPSNPWISDSLDHWDQEKIAYVINTFSSVTGSILNNVTRKYLIKIERIYLQNE